MEVEQYIPRPYQTEAVDFAIKHGRFILADEMGLGKTGPSLLALKAWGLGKAGPTLVVCGKNAQLAWTTHPKHWGCPAPTIIRGPAAQRRLMWKNYGGNPNRFVVCTREVLKRDLKSGWAPKEWFAIVADEAHRDTNRKTQNFKALKTLRSNKLIFITGSPMKRGPQNLWALLNILRPKVYTSYWRFVEKYCHVMVNEHGGWEILGPKPSGQLAQDLQTILLIRKKKDVAPWLPPKTRVMDVKLELSPVQRRIYDGLAEECIAELSEDQLVIAPTVLAKIVRLRQVLVCPKLLDSRLEDGAGIEHLVEMLEDSTDPHMVVFTPFASAIPYISARLQEEGYTSITHLRGGLKVEELGERIDKFRGERGICICSIKFAEAFDLIPATWAYFLGFEWDPNENWQAEDRLHRMNSTAPVTYYYPTHEGCIDEELVMEANDDKARSIHKVMNSVRDLRQRLQRKRRETTS